MHSSSDQLDAKDSGHPTDAKKSSTQPKKLLAIFIDYDGCVAHKWFRTAYNLESKSPPDQKACLLEANRALFEDIARKFKEGGYDDILILPNSARITRGRDDSNAFTSNAGSFFTAFLHIAAHLRSLCKLKPIDHEDTEHLADVLDDLKPGTTAKEALAPLDKHSGTHTNPKTKTVHPTDRPSWRFADDPKLLHTYKNVQEAAAYARSSMGTDTIIDAWCFDDVPEILGDIHTRYSKNSDLIPLNMTLHLLPYGSVKIKTRQDDKKSEGAEEPEPEPTTSLLASRELATNLGLTPIAGKGAHNPDYRFALHIAALGQQCDLKLLSVGDPLADLEKINRIKPLYDYLKASSLSAEQQRTVLVAVLKNSSPKLSDEHRLFCQTIGQLPLLQGNQNRITMAFLSNDIQKTKGLLQEAATHFNTLERTDTSAAERAESAALTCLTLAAALVVAYPILVASVFILAGIAAASSTKRAERAAAICLILTPILILLAPKSAMLIASALTIAFFIAALISLYNLTRGLAHNQKRVTCYNALRSCGALFQQPSATEGQATPATDSQLQPTAS